MAGKGRAGYKQADHDASPYHGPFGSAVVDRATVCVAPRRSNIEAIAQLKPNILPGAIDRPTLQIKRGVARTAQRRVARGSSTLRLAGAQTSRGCCQLEKGQASSNAMSRRFVSSWPFE